MSEIRRRIYERFPKTMEFLRQAEEKEMSRPFTIGSGDARLVLNELPSSGGLTVEVRGVACTVLLDRQQLLSLSVASGIAARRLPK